MVENSKKCLISFSRKFFFPQIFDFSWGQNYNLNWFLARKFKYICFESKHDSLRWQCCKMRLFEWFSDIMKPSENERVSKRKSDRDLRLEPLFCYQLSIETVQLVCHKKDCMAITLALLSTTHCATFQKAQSSAARRSIFSNCQFSLDFSDREKYRSRIISTLKKSMHLHLIL